MMQPYFHNPEFRNDPDPPFGDEPFEGVKRCLRRVVLRKGSVEVILMLRPLYDRLAETVTASVPGAMKLQMTTFEGVKIEAFATNAELYYRAFELWATGRQIAIATEEDISE